MRLDMNYFYGVFVGDSPDEERLVWVTLEASKDGRKYFIGGSGIVPCIFTAAGSANAAIKRMYVDFGDDAQFHCAENVH